jgi:hypothetical protein
MATTTLTFAYNVHASRWRYWLTLALLRAACAVSYVSTPLAMRLAGTALRFARSAFTISLVDR